MHFRFLGNSGLKISELTYGNWLTHGSQVENDTATACVRAALDVGITTFDTADVYANTVAESVLGDALAVAVSYMLSGYSGLFHAQKIVYSKLRPEFINRDTEG